jgi:hypothetical protein
MLDWLTPTCSATSATDRPRLIRASRRWRARVGLRAKEVILPLRAQELSDGKANQQVAGHKSITGPQQVRARTRHLALTHAEFGVLPADETIIQSCFGGRVRAPLAVPGALAIPRQSNWPIFKPENVGGGFDYSLECRPRHTLHDQSGGTDRPGSGGCSIRAHGHCQLAVHPGHAQRHRTSAMPTVHPQPRSCSLAAPRR